MSDKKYPYIGEGKRSGNIVLFTGKRAGVVIVEGESVVDKYQVGYKCQTWDEIQFKNITREYLANTYGKCESQEHADFICKLAENAGFAASNDYNEIDQWFCFDDVSVDFFTETIARNEKEKLIRLPLPPKEKPMEKTKPVYTKEMHKRGELPPVGSKCIHSGLINDFENRCGWNEGQLVEILSEYEGGVIFRRENHDAYGLVVDHTCNEKHFKPIPTIEDELIEFIDCGKGLKSIIIAKGLLEKYNVTPKDS